MNDTWILCLISVRLALVINVKRKSRRSKKYTLIYVFVLDWFSENIHFTDLLINAAPRRETKTYHTAGHTRLCSEWTLGLANPVLDPSGGMSFRAATSWKIQNFNENLWFPILGFLQTASWSYYTIIPSHIDQAMPIRAQIKTPFFEEK